jgi:hypothetical protein
MVSPKPYFLFVRPGLKQILDMHGQLKGFDYIEQKRHKCIAHFRLVSHFMHSSGYGCSPKTIRNMTVKTNRFLTTNPTTQAAK